MRVRALALAAVLAALLTLAPSAAAVIGGTPDGEDHPYVGFIHNRQFACTGAAISPTVFITAAHCFNYSGERVYVTFSSNRRSPTAVYTTGKWYPDPEFCMACGKGLPGFDTHDIAVVVLDRPVSLPRYATLPSLGLADSLPNGTQLALVGYGVEDFLNGGGPQRPVRPSGLRMYAPSNLLPSQHSISDSFLKLSANNSQDNGGACFGDSGGPNLLGDTIVSVNSFVTNGGCNGVTYSYRVDTADSLGFIAGF